MAKIIDPDDFVRSTSLANLGVNGNIWIDETDRKIALAEYSGLTEDGASLQSIYSYLKEEWKNDDDLIKYPFPMIAITPEQFEFQNNWTPSGSSTINYFRDAGFAVVSGSVRVEEYIGVITLGDVEDSQVYYSQLAGNASTEDFVLTGSVNQCVQISGASFDYKGYFKLFSREQGKLYDDATHTDIGVTTFTYQAYRFPLSIGADLNIGQEDSTIDQSGVTITYYETGQPVNIDGSNSYYDVIIDGNNIPKQNIYEAVQSQLRKSTDIDAGLGVVSGKTAGLLLEFVGDTLKTYPGVYIENFQAADTNSLEFYDTGGTVHTYPFVAAGSLNFNENLVTDASAIYAMFFTTLPNADSDFGEVGATLVQDNSGVVITGLCSSASIQFDFDYDNNVQGGRTAATEANVTVVGIGLDTAQYVVATGTITRSTANSISLVSALERNYTNE